MRFRRIRCRGGGVLIDLCSSLGNVLFLDLLKLLDLQRNNNLKMFPKTISKKFNVSVSYINLFIIVEKLNLFMLIKKLCRLIGHKISTADPLKFVY